MSNGLKQGVKSIGVGFIDFIISFPLFLAVSYLIFLFIACFRIPDKIASILFILVIAFFLIKLIVDTVRRKDKGLYAFWISLIICYLILLLIIFPLSIKKDFSRLLGFTLSGLFLSYLFLIIKSVKVQREKYGWGSGKFWGFWIGIPIAVVLIVIYIIPGLVILKNKGLDTRLNERIGISSVKELYNPSPEENGNHILETKGFPEDSKFTPLFNYIISYYTPIPDSVYKKEIEKSANLCIPYLDSLSKYSFIQKEWLGDYENNPFSAPIPDFWKAIEVAKAGLLSAVFDIHNKDYISASNKIEKVWDVARIVRDNNLISDMVSIAIGQYTIKFVFRGVREGWMLKKRFLDISQQILSDIKNLPIVIPGACEYHNHTLARLPGLLAEMFIMKEVSRRNPAEILFLYSSHRRRLLWKFAGRMFYPIMIFNYPSMLKLMQIYIPVKFSSKDDFIKYYLNNDIRKNVLKFKKVIEKRLISNMIISLFMPDFSRIIDNEIDYIALSRVMQTAINVERERIRTGKYPEQPKNILKDPFSGNPLIYKRIDRGYIIYSVGANRIDDGGDVISITSKDIGFWKEVTKK